MVNAYSHSEPDKRRAGKWDFSLERNLGREMGMKTNRDTDAGGDGRD